MAPQQRFAEYPEMLEEVMRYLDGNEEEMLRAATAHATIEPVSV